MIAFFSWLSDSLLSATGTFVSFLDRMIPPVPSELASACSELQSASAFISPVARFLPLSYLGVALGVLFVGVGVSIAIKVSRILISFATMGGGSAG